MEKEDADVTAMRMLDLRADAKRYAAAATRAAAAAAVIDELQQALEESEYNRRAAEEQLDKLNWRSALGKVFTAVDDELDDVKALMDLESGDVWIRHEHESMWGKWDESLYGPMWHEWPLDGAGPFIAFNDSWSLRRLIEKSRENAQAIADVRIVLRGKVGAREVDPATSKEKPYPEKPLHNAVKDVLANYDTKLTHAGFENRELKAEIEVENKLWRDSGQAMQDVRDKALTIVPASSEVHGIVKQAELEIIQDCEVPEEGDPEYNKNRLVRAAALLTIAASSL